MISFYPGPSQVRASVEGYLRDAFHSGILSQNHRGRQFQELLSKTETLFYEKLNVPAGYRLFLASSATEIWEILTQSFPDLGAVHVFNGAFGEKWFNYARFVKPACQAVRFGIEELPKDFDSAPIVCLTHNETSNGTALSFATLEKIRKQHAESLIFVDAVSSMAGVDLPWAGADVWFASVQKCFGLPAGLAVGLVSERALQMAALQSPNKHYNSLAAIMSNMDKHQTTHTPNVLGIYLLFRTLQDLPSISQIHAQTLQRAEFWRQTLKAKSYELLCKNIDAQSDTVFCVKSNDLKNLTEKCSAQGIELGKGYGDLKETTFRIANFPALDTEHLRLLADVL